MWHPKATNDDGFTLAELLVTMVIIATVLIGLIGVQVSAMRTVALAKQRQQAVALANQTIEQLRALPYLTVGGGLLSSDLAGDTNISAGRLRPTYSASIDEVLVTSTTQATAPLTPHIQPSAMTKVGGTQFDARVYVSLAGADATAGYWLTSIVKWTSSVTKNVPKTIAVRSQLFSPSGCLSTATHPFSGPCQAFLYGNSGTTPAGITLQAVDTVTTELFAGVDLVAATVALPAMSAAIQMEQALSAQGKATTSGVHATTLGLPMSVGNQAATSAADTDPSTGTASGTSTGSASQSSNSLTMGGVDNAVGLNAGGSDSATSVSTTAATSSDGCKEATGGSPLATNNVCTSSAVNPGGSLSATYLGIPLASIGSGSASRASVAHFTSPGATRCVAATGVGCVSAGSLHNVGTAVVGTGLPGLVGGFTNLVSLTGYSATAVAESGLGAGAPTTLRSGSLTYRGTGLLPNVVALTPSTSLSVALPASTAISGPLSIGMSGDLRVLPAPAVTTTGSAPCAVAACTVAATVPSVTVTVTFNITLLGVQVAYFNLHLDLGSALAKSTYKAAPSA